MPRINPRGRGAGLGAEVRRLRLELGLTQAELADRVGDGMTQADVSGIERGAVILPSIARLEKIAAALGVAPGHLLEKSGYAGATDAFSERPVLKGAARARVVACLDLMNEPDTRVLAMVAERFVRLRRRRGRNNHAAPS